MTSISFFCMLALAAPCWAEDPDLTNDDLWKSAEAAYADDNIEAGHKRLRLLIEKNSGDVDLAVKCLEQIRDKAGLHSTSNPWLQYAVHRLCALERLGALSANSLTVQESMNTRTSDLTQQGQRFEAAEETGRMAEANSHDIYWRLLQAQVLRRLDSIKTRPLYEQLKAEMDLDHPDPRIRHRWNLIAQELESDFELLPKPIDPLPVGSPLLLMELDDPEGRWQTVAARSPQTVPDAVDRLAGQAMIDDLYLVWRDMSGLTNPTRALDLHLLSQPVADMLAVRKAQTESFAQEDIPASLSEAKVLALFRRYPWALLAQKLLLTQANRTLLAGRAQSALRSFQDLLDHAADAKLKAEAQVGFWTALAQIAEPDQIANLIGDIDPKTTYTWMGKPTTAAEIRDKLLAAHSPIKSTDIPPLRDLKLHIVRVPPVAPWPAETPSGGVTVDMRVAGRQLLISGRNLIAMYDAEQPREPLWARIQRHPAEASSPGAYHAGYFRPTIGGPVLYSRWGFTSVPTGITAFDRSSGQPLWAGDRLPLSPSHREFHVPIGDPVLSDGLLYYLQWNTRDNVNHNRGRRLTLVCFDPLRKEELWNSTIAEAGLATDFLAQFERAAPQLAIYGNRVTIHRGSIYSNSNAGIVARSDARDGRTDWLHYYRQGGSSQESLGSSPIAIGEIIICMPRDAGGRVFALDQRTGRLVWENTLVLGVEVVGVLRDTLIVRGQTSIAALALETGKVRWYLPITNTVLARAQSAGDSIFLANSASLQQLDAHTGRIQETRSWDLNDERPHGFTISGRNLYVVTDKPAEDDQQKLREPLNPNEVAEADPLALPLKRAWSLPRSNASVSLPPAGSLLSGKGYLLCGGILECIDVSAQGAIRWRRFVNTREARIRFVGTKLLIIERGSSRAPGISSRLLAFDGELGKSLWDAPIAKDLDQLVLCDSMLVFYNNRGHILAVDSGNGERAWERDVQGQLTALSWDGSGLHGIYVPQWKYARHITLDPASGQSLNESTIETQTESTSPNNGKRLNDGYYEITFEPVDARYVRLVALSEINYGHWTSIAELQVVGGDGVNLSRKDWRTVKVDSVETQSRYNTTPEAAFDNDPVTWWHTKWTGGIPPHPHEIQIDLGSRQTIKGIRYLPAVIINNNGMIRDYELFAGDDTNNWGSPVAKGVFVNRVRIENPKLAERAVFFEVHNRPKNTRGVFRYDLDGKPAKQIIDNGRLEAVRGPYVVMSIRRDNKDILTVLRSDDPSYRFELTSEHPLHRDGEIQIDGDRLILGRRSWLVADLASRTFIVPPTKDSEKHNRPGMIFCDGANNLLKIVPLGNEGQAFFQCDMRTGRQTEFILANQIEQFQDRRQPSQQGSIQHFDGVLLLNDNSAVTAWIHSVP